ncbi:MAG: peptidoglycan DD-metalloendopeptidase family protein, partial [Chloroflexota bacterium]
MGDFKFERWPTEYRVITQPFGANPGYYSQFGLPGHEGVDIRALSGTKIFCVAQGRVYRVHRDHSNHNYGIHVRIQHRDGYQTIYAHLEEVFVDQGDVVQAGTVLGIADSTGNSAGSHLHFSLKKSGSADENWPYNIIDPTPYLLPLMAWKKPVGPYVSGWINRLSLYIVDNLGQVGRDDATLHLGPDEMLIVPEGTIVILEGKTHHQYEFVQVSRVGLDLPIDDLPNEPDPPPPATVATIYGWAWAADLNIGFEGDQAIVNSPYGVNIREKPDNESYNIGIVKKGSTMTLMGERRAGYLYVQARRVDFIGPIRDPSKLPELPKEKPGPLPDGVYLGWITTQFLRKIGIEARLPHRSVSLRSAPGPNGRYVGTVLGDTTVKIAGQTEAGFTPVYVSEEAFLRLADPIPSAEHPKPINPHDLVTSPNGVFHVPLEQSRSGWVLSGEIEIKEYYAVADHDGLNLRDRPQRDSQITGFIPPGTPMMVTDKAAGEFVPVRIDISLLQPPIQNVGDVESFNPDPPIIHRARIGLHASADPMISEQEHKLFKEVRPGLIKFLSFHSATDIARLAQSHSKAAFVIRAFLDFGERQISPDRFMHDTLPDVRRALNQLRGREVVVELHNEPNLTAEGMGRSWRNGTEFSRWYIELLTLYRRELPTTKFLFPGLSPGHSVKGIKEDHIRFAEAAR